MMKTNYEKKCKKRLLKRIAVFQPSFLMKKIVNTVNSLQEKWRNTDFWRCRTAVFAASLFILSTSAYAADNPVTSGVNWVNELLFGALGIGICSIVLGVTFQMAKLGKIGWDRFVTVAASICGFFGAPSIVMMLYAISHH